MGVSNRHVGICIYSAVVYFPIVGQSKGAAPGRNCPDIPCDLVSIIYTSTADIACDNIGLVIVVCYHNIGSIVPTGLSILNGKGQDLPGVGGSGISLIDKKVCCRRWWFHLAGCRTSITT